MSRSIPWQEIRSAYRAGATCRELAERYGVAQATLYDRRKRENWDDAPAPLDDLTARLEALVTSLLTASDGGDVTVKDVKELAALVKDLTALRRGRRDDAPAVIRVELSEDVAPWAE